jgi:hypothetical protein
MARKGGTPENLIPPVKGERRNPHGRPVGSRSRSTIVKYWLEAIKEARNPITGELEQLPVADQIVLSLIGKALKGDVMAFKELMDSGYGKLTEKLQHSGEINIPPIKWANDKD